MRTNPWLRWWELSLEGCLRASLIFYEKISEKVLISQEICDIRVEIYKLRGRRKMHNDKLLLFDLDDTLLRSDKTISKYTLDVLKRCREKGYLVGVSTSRGESNSSLYISELSPDIIICSGGAVVKYKGEYVYIAEFAEEETNRIINLAKAVCGKECKITIDTLTAHFWSFRREANERDASWADTIFADFSNLHEKALKICVEIMESERAKQLAEILTECDCIKFADGDWYKFTKKEATKGNAIERLTASCGISPDQIIAFGDDVPDIGMLQLCGIGVAMGNALEEVKAAADAVIGTNDEDGIAKYLEENCLGNKESI